MTEALKKAFEKASQLPESDQDSLAAAILVEIENEEAWESAFSSSQESLGVLADEALEEHRRRKSRPLDPRDR